MEPELRIGEMLEALEAEPLGGKLRADRKVRIGTDTRTIGKGEIFWVLKGENFDGHDYVETAFEKGLSLIHI